MPESPKPPAEPGGWKEIAANLGVSVRTAQNSEKERGLPVRRAFGTKAPVSALAAAFTVVCERLRKQVVAIPPAPKTWHPEAAE